ncbi:aminotransferase class V-fold PLP-dependent enzyme [Polaribacter sp. HL-MS24]|uniref:aminotransferase class V-fold PLP-dependent enzyme n=1 Tax=Polaribacter sp. HL-MS24 TaxID=3077735 RepID=UPI0029347B51|nr:aminotransferase class V-fold PLP-dependent enzyme [Polaribacter sp. HL-MS24]WOC39651.1 aminotransferase class V-fold PLP-dependent enzyme [Polaribacter sp. HL-MS24]
MNYHELLRDQMAKIVGAKPLEVVVMNTLTTNLHLLMVSFYKPTKIKYKIVIESDAFPSDRYAVQSQLKFHGFSEEDLIEWKPRKGEELLRIEDLEHIISEKGDEIALLLIGGVNYYTGQFLDLPRIAEIGHSKNCKVGIDLAHGAGNIQPNLHDSGVDFAAWCTYKYLNSGPEVCLVYLFMKDMLKIKTYHDFLVGGITTKQLVLICDNPLMSWKEQRAGSCRTHQYYQWQRS